MDKTQAELFNRLKKLVEEQGTKIDTLEKSNKDLKKKVQELEGRLKKESTIIRRLVAAATNLRTKWVNLNSTVGSLSDSVSRLKTK